MQVKINKSVKNRKRCLAIKQAMATRSLYQSEYLVLNIWQMRRLRSLQFLQTVLDVLWNHYSKVFGSRLKKPKLYFGKGIKYHGRYLSYTQSLDYGQEIVLASNERNLYVLVHELSHAIGSIQHGIRFSQIYHDILQHRIFQKMMSTEDGQKFLQYLKIEHPKIVRKAYRG